MRTEIVEIRNFKILSFFIALMPVSYAVGSLILSINSFVIIIYGLYNFKSEIFTVNNKSLGYLIYFFFFYVIFITVYNNINFLDQSELYKENIIKSFLYLRYLLLFLVVNKLAEKGLLQINYLYYTSMFMVSFLLLDILLQFYSGKNIFGIVSEDPNRLAGFFGNEYIAGGYLQIFSFFLILSSILFSKSKKIFLAMFLISTILLVISIPMTGNRMPFILFLLCLLLFSFLERRLRKVSLAICLVFFTLSTILINLDPKEIKGYDKVLKIHSLTNDFYKNSKDIFLNSKTLFEGNMKNEVKSAHLKTFYAGVDLWKENRVFGSGLKSFRINCKFGFNKLCSTHPHNYYIELLLDVGLIGFLSISSIFVISLWGFLKKNYLTFSKTFYERLLVLPPFLIVFAYAFPIKSSGSFFTTTVSTFIFLFLAILINSEKIKLNKA
tara:strand:- start:79 stop:1395 length:1317 start_codon:yes stop_codon:yes gene_type:complete